MSIKPPNLFTKPLSSLKLSLAKDSSAFSAPSTPSASSAPSVPSIPPASSAHSPLPAPQTCRGDTLIEVMIAIAIFGLVSMITVNIMNLSLSTSEGALEQTVVRREIDAQTEAIRFIHRAYIAEKKTSAVGGPYQRLWGSLVTDALDSSATIEPFPFAPSSSAPCQHSSGNHNFVVNVRKLAYDPSIILSDSDIAKDIIVRNRLKDAPVYSRLIYSKNASFTDDDENQLLSSADPANPYTNLAKAEGIWDFAVKGPAAASSSAPEYYDFYIRTCWVAPGKHTPTFLGTTIRLHNPSNP